MEAPEFFCGGSCRASTPQFGFDRRQSDIKSSEHFIIEDLLDFSNEDAACVGDDTFDVAAGNSRESSPFTVVDSGNSSFPGGNVNFSGDLPCQDLGESQFSGDLCVPCDDLQELEWLSNFVEESFSSEHLEKLKLISDPKAPAEEVSETRDFAINTSRNAPVFRPEMSVPAKARSKRSRAATCNWSSRLLVVSPASSESESGITSDSGRKAGKSTPKTKDSSEDGSGEGRTCLHCGTDKTPQWRTGPMGPKTLCNACGVRYKSGRLVPEYRPAASPTFVLTMHSNSHRKVLELRRQKELQRSQQQQFLRPNSVYDVIASGGDDYLIHHDGPDFRQLI